MGSIEYEVRIRGDRLQLRRIKNGAPLGAWEWPGVTRAQAPTLWARIT